MKCFYQCVSVLVSLLCIVSSAWAGQNASASISIDFNYTTSGNQGIVSLAPQSVGYNLYLEVRVDNASNLDTYEFDLLYPSSDLTYVNTYSDNFPPSSELNFLKKSGGSPIGFIVDAGTPGVVNVAYTLPGTDEAEAPEGEGLLAVIAFTYKVAAPGNLTFGDVDWYDNNGVHDVGTIKGDASLPVQLSSLIATSGEGEGVTIAWRTESEFDCSGFQVWRSEENQDAFKQITTALVPGQGNSSSAFEYTYTDQTAKDGVIYWYQVIEIATDGSKTVFGPISVEGASAIPTEFALSQNYPNPFNPETNIKYQLPNKEHVQITIYNIKGEKVLELINQDQDAGYYDITWDGKDANQTLVSTGVYVILLQAGNFQSIKKAMMLR